jgi:hemerythrin-like domain-containing protein
VSKAIDDLKHDHEAIISALRVLDQIIIDIGKGSQPERVDLVNFVNFLKEFADKCHHGKEEGILFPALTQAGIPERGGPVGVMLSEHLLGRELIKKMERALGNAPDYKKFATAAKEYVSLLQSHIEKENNVLFPIAERTLDAARLESLYESFEEHEEKVIGHGRHEELHGMLKGLRSKYLNGQRLE